MHLTTIMAVCEFGVALTLGVSYFLMAWRGTDQ